MNPHRVRKPVDEFDETPSKYPSQLPATSDGKTPRVLIVGAGIGGLFLGIILDRAGIPYEIFERATEIKQLGSIMGINANILPVLEQLGIYEEFAAMSSPIKQMSLRYGSMKKIATLTMGHSSEEIGYDYMMLPRPRLHEFLLSKVPAENIHYGKKVLSMIQNKEGAMIRCADGTTYHGDVLVGADGAYSAVRQSLYRSLQDKNVLPPGDTRDLHKGFTCLVGTTNPLDPEKYPYLLQDRTESFMVIEEGTQYTWSFLNVPDNRICFLVIRQYETLAECEHEKFANSEWGPEKCGDMIDSIRHFKLPLGGTLGDFIDQTPRDQISRVYLEDKLFETWTHGRTAMIGDAVHKMLPSAGQGAVCAMQDAVVLANCLYDLKDLRHETIEAALDDYKQQRFHQVEIQVHNSNTSGVLLFGQTLVERMIRYVVFHWLPESLKKKSLLKDASYRPQLAFLPLAPKRGTCPVQPQKPSKRYEDEQRKRREEEEKNKREGGETSEKTEKSTVAL